MKLNLDAKTPTETRVLQYLENNASDVLAEKINAGKKTLAGALKYAKDEAKKLAAGESCICVDDATVFGWIVHFFEEDPIAEPEPMKPAVKVPAGVSVKPAQAPKPKAKRAKKVSEQATMFEALFSATDGVIKQLQKRDRLKTEGAKA